MWDNQMWDEKKWFTEWFTSYSAAWREILARTDQELGLVVDGGRTDHRDYTDRRHESDPHGDDIRDGSGEIHGRASRPGVRESWRWQQ